MKLAWAQRWDVTPAEAREIQHQTRRRVVLTDDPAASFSPARVFAADVGYDKLTNLCFAALVEWDVAAGREVAHWTRVEPAAFPYIPGLLSFREIPPLLPLFEALPSPPELVLCDAQGIAHPRRVGLASHLGVILGVPTLGWAKTRLVGTYEEPPLEGGSASPLLIGKEQVGWVFRSRTAVAPTFVSPGHLMSLERALELARALRGRYRLCDPARRAHELTRLLLQQHRAQA